ncbi:tetratricopeptide repeat protein [Dyella sp. ASV21]|uniref:tetratricopeptide repeat protein n=1 Tax=Dyella sp. ASV21 TaxID=2795114 RepID=UPI0018EC4F7B|nr:tetratricopeptide repeat protein [Dyella sp. ASV21]
MNGRKDQHEHGSQGRTEPTMGNLDNLEAPVQAPRDDDGLPHFSSGPEHRRGSSARPPAPRERKRGWLIPVVLLVAIGAGTGLWIEQDKLRGLVPSTELDGVLGRAEIALQEGRLDGNDGSSARELFEAARALQPDNDRARDGLRKVGLAEVARADAALQAGKLDEADQALAAARELLGGGSDVDRLGQALSAARNGSVQTANLIEQAQAALDAGKLDGDGGAGALYRKVLTADPGNAVASHGLDKVGEALAAQAHKALDAGDRATASTLTDRLAALLPNYGELPALRAALVQASQQDNSQLTDAIKQGQDALRAGRIAGEGNDTALAYFKAALAIDPDNADAKAGLGQVAQALIVQANAAIDSGDNAQARKLLDQAAAWAPRSAELAAARAHLGDTRKAAAPTDGVGPAQDADNLQHPPLTPQQSAELARTVQRAEAAAAQGKLMLPPGESAYDLYRQALAIDGNNETARHGLETLPNLAISQFNQALAAGRLSVASDRLADLSDLSPGDAGQGQLRQRLAGAWMDQAEQQLQSGDRPGAAQSLDGARKLAPGNPRLTALMARLSSGP